MPVTVEQFSRTVASVYEAGLDSSHWGVALQDVAELMMARTAAVVVPTPSGTQMVFAATEAPYTGLESFNAYYGRIEPLSAGLRVVTPGQVLLTPEIWDPDHPAYNEFFHDWMRPNESSYGAIATLATSPQIVNFGVGHSRPELLEPHRIEIFRQLVPHLCLAARAWLLLDDLRIADRAKTEALERFRHGVIILDGTTVRLANAAARAIAADNDGLVLRGNGIGATGPRADAAIQRAIRAASSGEPEHGARLVVSRPSGRRPLIMTILPMGAASSPVDIGRRAVLVLVTDPCRGVAIDPASLAELFGFTRAEATVAIAMLDGKTLKGVADELEVALSTVRTHLDRVFQKTGTHRQPQLVRLLLELQ